MKRYKLLFGHVEMSKSAARRQYGDTLPEGLFEQDEEPELIAQFTDESQARAALAERESCVYRFQSGGVWHVAAEGYFIAEEEFIGSADDDVDDSDYWEWRATLDWTPMPTPEEDDEEDDDD